MSPANKQFLTDNQYLLDDWERSQVFRNLGHAQRQGIMQLIADEFQPGYSVNLNCPSCVGEMLSLAVKLVKEWKAKKV